MLFDMDFEDSKDRLKFEAHLKKKCIKCRPLTDYHKEKEEDRFQTVVYDVGFLGYAEPQMILDDCKLEKIKIKFMAWLPISDRKTEWEKIRGRW